MFAIDAAIAAGLKIIDKIIPDPEQKAKAQLDLLRLQQEGGLKEVEQQLSVLLAEAQSADPWTSRARPSFLYVMYAMILAAIPMGVISAINPSLAVQIAEGMKAWLAAIPSELWAVFGVGYSGYTLARSAFDKRTGK